MTELTVIPGSQRGASSIGQDGWDPDCRYGLVPVPVAPLMPVAGLESARSYNCCQFILSRPPLSSARLDGVGGLLQTPLRRF